MSATLFLTKEQEINAAKTWKCGACDEIVPYGKHCSKVPNGDVSQDKTHADFVAKNGHLYEEVIKATTQEGT
jgi:hypothetical protein